MINPREAALSLLDEFRNFAFKGNVVDLAVGVIIGAAFGKIVDALVKHILMPVIGVILPGQQGYLAWKLTLDGKDIPYGLFLGELLNFLIIATVLFFVIRKFLGLIMKMKVKEAAAPPPPPPPVPPPLTRDQELLSEIRDLLRKRSVP